MQDELLEELDHVQQFVRHGYKAHVGQVQDLWRTQRALKKAEVFKEIEKWKMALPEAERPPEALNTNTYNSWRAKLKKDRPGLVKLF